MQTHEKYALAVAVFGGLCIIIACYMSVTAAQRWGYRRAATFIYEELRLFRDDSYEEYSDKVAGLTEAMYISRYHIRNYNTAPTGRKRRPRPDTMTTNSAAPVALTAPGRRGMHRRGH